eukprot:TRINITY_DN2264_c1_g1_i1.p1 TRINITY_DN2264_c1_g1~~TRINITY_DN2264_c1_g1_i1.p1  ORF type:complete len:537 (+),score=193.85 TRINITY_DN2264_c1_g1_i1:59-1669(+)
MATQEQQQFQVQKRLAVISQHLLTEPQNLNVKNSIFNNCSNDSKSSTSPYLWSNWARTETCHPNYVHFPINAYQIKETIRICIENNEKLRVFGGSCSPSDLCCTSDHLLSLNLMNKIINIDFEKREVEVEAGIYLSELSEELFKVGLAITNLPAISEMSIAGVISTGAHGTGVNFGLISSHIISIDLINGKAEDIHCSRDENTDLFSAALCSLGSIGIIYKVKIKCEPTFNLHAFESIDSFDNLIDNLHENVNSAEYYRFWWYPHTDKCLTWSANKITEQIFNINEKEIGFVDNLIDRHLFEVSLLASNYIPYLFGTSINKFYLNRASKKLQIYTNPTNKISKPIKHYIGRSDQILHASYRYSQRVSEWFVPDYNAKETLKQLKYMVNSFTKRGIHIHSPIEIKFIKADFGESNKLNQISNSSTIVNNGAWLSPVQKTRNESWFCAITIVAYRPFNQDPKNYKSYFDSFSRLMTYFNGRPHWSTDLGFWCDELNGGSIELFKSSYPRWNQFIELIKQMDPNRVFSNEWIERVFQIK